MSNSYKNRKKKIKKQKIQKDSWDFGSYLRREATKAKLSEKCTRVAEHFQKYYPPKAKLLKAFVSKDSLKLHMIAGKKILGRMKTRYVLTATKGWKKVETILLIDEKRTEQMILKAAQ